MEDEVTKRFDSEGKFFKLICKVTMLIWKQ